MASEEQSAPTGGAKQLPALCVVAKIETGADGFGPRRTVVLGTSSYESDGDGLRVVVDQATFDAVKVGDRFKPQLEARQ